MRDAITTLLELLGGLLLAAAAGLAIAQLNEPAGIAVGGVALLGESWVLERLHRKPPPAPNAEPPGSAY